MNMTEFASVLSSLQKSHPGHTILDIMKIAISYSNTNIHDKKISDSFLLTLLRRYDKKVRDDATSHPTSKTVLHL